MGMILDFLNHGIRLFSYNFFCHRVLFSYTFHPFFVRKRHFRFVFFFFCFFQNTGNSFGIIYANRKLNGCVECVCVLAGLVCLCVRVCECCVCARNSIINDPNQKYSKNVKRGKKNKFGRDTQWERREHTKAHPQTATPQKDNKLCFTLRLLHFSY